MTRQQKIEYISETILSKDAIWSFTNDYAYEIILNSLRKEIFNACFIDVCDCDDDVTVFVYGSDGQVHMFEDIKDENIIEEIYDFCLFVE